MKKVFSFIAMAAVTVIACNKESNVLTPDQNNEKTSVEVVGQPCTLTLGLDPETKVSHEYAADGKVKTQWQNTDKIALTIAGADDSGSWEVQSISADGKTATFHNENSKLGSSDAEAEVKIYYPAKSLSWQNQTAKADLSDWVDFLTATGKVKALPTTLTSGLVYLHFNLTGVSQKGIARTFTTATLSEAGNTLLYNSNLAQGSITIAADDGKPFTINADGSVANMEFFVATNFVSPDGEKTLYLTFSNEASGDVATYQYAVRKQAATSSPKHFARGNVYKLEGVVNNTYYTIPQGKQVNMNFTCNTIGGLNWQYWSLNFTDNNTLSMVRPDGCYTFIDWENENTYPQLTHNITDWEKYPSVMEGAAMAISVKNFPTGLRIAETAATNGADKIYEFFAEVGKAEDYTVVLTEDSSTITKSSTDVSSIELNNNLLTDNIGTTSVTFAGFTSWGNADWTVGGVQVKEKSRMTLNVGESHTFRMKITSGGAERWHCPGIELWNNDWTACYGDAFVATHWWGSSIDVITPTSNWANDDEIKAALKTTPTAYVTIFNAGGRAAIIWSTTYNGEERHVFYENMPVDNGPIKYCFVSENCTVSFE